MAAEVSDRGGKTFFAELEVVPAGNARDCGLTAALILAYGQDDRS